MTEPIRLSIDASGLADGLGRASAEISRLAREEIAPAAGLIEDAFAAVAATIERDLGRAARAGEFSLKSLARSVVSDLRRVAVDSLVRKPIENLLAGAFAAPFGGGRAGGGFAARGQSFLVGERGPELFTPAVSGRIDPPGGRGVVVNIALPGVTDADSFRRSQTQIAAALARALGRGERNL
jgi:phage-related minor tail protein